METGDYCSPGAEHPAGGPARAAVSEAGAGIPVRSERINPERTWGTHPHRKRGNAPVGTVTDASPASPVRAAELAIGGMTCASCATRMAKKLNKLDGVSARGQLRHRERA
jgi:hypothetical protein